MPLSTSSETGQSILDRIGNTPLLSLRKIARRGDRVRLLLKAEWLNPGGSIKDRSILNIVKVGEEQGRLTKGKTILDSTSGNAGISYALIGAAKGYSVKLCVPSNVTSERKRILLALGAELVFTNPLEGSDGAIKKAQRLYRANPVKYFYGDQYNNPANLEAHYQTTGPEIIDQTQGAVTHFVAGVGTSGTMMGVGKKLREFNHEIKVIEVQPSSSFHGIEGLKYMENSLRPGIYDSRFADERIAVETEEAQAMAVRLAVEEGLLVGTSAGANLVAALKVAGRIKRGVVVTVLPDSAERYLSELYWSQSLGKAPSNFSPGAVDST